MNPQWFQYTLIGGLALLAASAQFFVYAAYVVPRAEAAHDLQSLADTLQSEQQQRPAVQSTDNRGVTIPDLLSRVQEIAAQYDVTVTGAQPSPNDPEQFKLSLAARYPSLLQFLAQFETLQVAIVGFDIAPAMKDPRSVVASLTFNHTAAPGQAGSEAVKQFEARMRAVALHDPFDPSAPAVQRVVNPNPQDPAYHLTSISQVGKSRYATIDGRDYSVGDRLQSFVVSAITNDQVTLVARGNGKETERVLKFRKGRESGI
jgi:hypothetical protein